MLTRIDRENQSLPEYGISTEALNAFKESVNQPQETSPKLKQG